MDSFNAEGFWKMKWYLDAKKQMVGAICMEEVAYYTFYTEELLHRITGQVLFQNNLFEGIPSTVLSDIINSQAPNDTLEGLKEVALNVITVTPQRREIAERALESIFQAIESRDK